MLSSMPGKGLGTAAKRIAQAAARPTKGREKMDFLKRKLVPMKKREGMPMKKEGMPLEKMKQRMPLQNKMMPMKKKQDAPSFMKPGYKPGSIMRGYTKYT